MIRRPTVLILGAGASKPYGYPLGHDLVGLILALTRPPSGGLVGTLSREEPLQRLIAPFHEHLSGSKATSIDDFLESNREYQEIGKICIAAALTLWGPLAGHRPLAEHDWYLYLWDQLRRAAPNEGAFADNRVQIVTYNYERSFERFFTDVLYHYYPNLAKSGRDRAQAIQESYLPVVHVHGMLEASAEQVISAPDRQHFNDLAFFRDIAKGIRIVHEGQHSIEYTQARTWLREADTICVLGFSYHPASVKLLDVPGAIRGRAGVFFGGTALGLEDQEIKRAEVSLGLDSLGMQPALTAVDARLYLRKYARLE